MKHTLRTLPLLGTLSVLGAASALPATASTVDLYGVLDYGLSVQTRDPAAGETASTLQMKSGQYIGSRFGIKGVETLDNGLKVGFVLESGIGADTGSLGQSGRLFGRDARLFLEGDFGFLSFGRMGSMVGGNGPYARFGHVVSPFSCGWGDIGGTLQVVSLGYEFIDNAVAYTTPKVGGFDATVQYSFGSDVKNYGADGVEGKSSVERMAAGTVRWQSEALMVAAGVESINHAEPAASKANLGDALSWNLGASYQAGWAKFYTYGQVFENYAAAAKVTTFALESGVDGWGAIVGVDVPAFGGTAKFSFGHGDFEGSRQENLTMKTWQTSVGYTHALSRRTTLYTAAGWIKSEYSRDYLAQKPSAVENVYEATVGVVHKF